MKKIIIKRTNPKILIRANSRTDSQPVCSGYDHQSKVNENEAPGCLCFILGFLLGPIGVVVAAIIGKTKGTVRALLGFICCGVIFAIIYIIIICCAVSSVRSAHPYPGKYEIRGRGF